MMCVGSIKNPGGWFSTDLVKKAGVATCWRPLPAQSAQRTSASSVRHLDFELIELALSHFILSPTPLLCQRTDDLVGLGMMSPCKFAI